MARAYNPVRHVILQKLQEMRHDLVSDEMGRRIVARTNLEALVDVIFERAISKKGRVPIEAAKLLFEYGVGKPNILTDDAEPMRIVRGETSTAEELKAEVDEALRELGVDAEYELLEDDRGSDRRSEAAGEEGSGGRELVPVAGRSVTGSGDEEAERARQAEKRKEIAKAREAERKPELYKDDPDGLF